MARAIWSGSLSFGLVSIPVKLLSAVHEKSISFHMLAPDGKCRVRQKLWCPETGKELERFETLRGYEIGPEQYVLVSDEELAALRPEAARTIDISEFIDLEQVDPVYYDRAYYLAPEKGGAKPYQLLVQAMQRTGKAALATFVMRQRQYLCAVRPVQGKVLVLQTMHYADEVTMPDDLEPVLGSAADLREKELAMAESLIESLGADFDPGAYHDEYREKLEELLEAKASGKEIVVAPDTEPEAPRVGDLIAALEASLAAARARTRPAGAEASPPKPRATAKEPRSALEGVAKEEPEPPPERLSKKGPKPAAGAVSKEEPPPAPARKRGSKAAPEQARAGTASSRKKK